MKLVDSQKYKINTCRIKHLFVFGLLYSLSSTVFSQRISEISRDIEVNNKIFTESFEYTTSNNQMIKNGQYKIFNIQRDSTLISSFGSSIITGKFKNNQMDGLWTLSSGYYEVTDETIFDNRRYSYNTNGSEFSASGNFINGLKNGIWNYNNWIVKSSNISDTLSHISVNFKKDKIAGVVTFENKDFLIEINVNADGYADGKWRYYQYNGGKKKILRKELIFEKNILKEKVLFQNEKTHKITFDKTRLDNITTVALDVDDNFFKILKLKTIISNQNSNFSDELMDETNNLFLESIHFINALDSLFKNVSDNDITPTVKVNLHQYILSEKEIEYFDNLVTKVRSIDSTISVIQNDPQINLAKISNPEIEKNIAILNAIDNNMINPIDSICNLYKDGTLIYLNRTLLVNHFLSLNHKIDLTFKNNSDTYSYYPNMSFNAEEPCENLSLFLKEVDSEVTSISDQLDKYIFEVKKEKKLVEKESQLLKKYEYLIHLNDSLKNFDLNTLAGFNLDETIKKFIDVELAKYTQLDVVSVKIDQINNYITCFENVEKLINSVQQVPKQIEIIEEKYIKNVFNPYISDYMEEIKKPNIYNKYKTVLIPKMFEQINLMKCSNSDQVSLNFEKTYNGMLNILEENTRKIERKVKKEEDPVKISELLNFNLVFE